MKRQTFGNSNSKIFVYALGIAFIIGICLIVVQDIKVPVTHVSNEIAVNLEK